MRQSFTGEVSEIKETDERSVELGNQCEMDWVIVVGLNPLAFLLDALFKFARRGDIIQVLSENDVGIFQQSSCVIGHSGANYKLFAVFQFVFLWFYFTHSKIPFWSC